MDKNIKKAIVDRIKQETNLDSYINESGDVIIGNVTRQLHGPIVDERSKITKILLEIANEFRLNPSDFAHSFNEKTDTMTINYEKDR